MGSPLTVRIAPVNAPKTDPDFARMISAVSGFFFCGIIDEVEQNASSRVTNFTNDVLQIISSSQSRLVVTIRMERSASVSSAKSRGYRVHRVCHQPFKTQQAGGIFTVDGVTGGCEGCCTERGLVHPHIGILKPVEIPGKCLFIRKEMVCKRGRLCMLQVGKSRHHGLDMLSQRGQQALPVL